jgi:hypothetical protein
MVLRVWYCSVCKFKIQNAAFVTRHSNEATTVHRDLERVRDFLPKAKMRSFLDSFYLFLGA